MAEGHGNNYVRNGQSTDMFCERCGRILKDGELTCPECGAYYGPTEITDPPKRSYFFISFVISAAAMTAASFYLGFYSLLFMLLFWIGGKPETNLGMVLKGVGLGVTAGCLIGLIGRLLLTTL